MENQIQFGIAEDPYSGTKPCTPGEHQNRWYIGVPPQNGIGIAYDPWPHKAPDQTWGAERIVPTAALSAHAAVAGAQPATRPPKRGSAVGLTKKPKGDLKSAWATHPENKKSFKKGGIKLKKRPSKRHPLSRERGGVKHCSAVRLSRLLNKGLKPLHGTWFQEKGQFRCYPKRKLQDTSSRPKRED